MNRKHSCDDLGICQQQVECHLPCDGKPEPNRFPFAPGTIDYAPSTGTAREWAIELLAASIALAAVFAVIGFALGFLNLPGWPL